MIKRKSRYFVRRRETGDWVSNSFVTIIFFQSTFFKQATGRWAIQRTKIFFVIEDTPAETTGKVNGRSGKLRKILAKKRLILRGTLFRHFSKHNICLKTKWDVFTKPTASCPISGINYCNSLSNVFKAKNKAKRIELVHRLHSMYLHIALSTSCR